MDRQPAMIALIGLVFVAGLAAAGYRAVFDPGSSDGAPIQVAITEGATASDIAAQLEEEGAISSAFRFRIFLRVVGSDATLKAGEYELRRDMGFRDLLAELEKGPEVEFARLTIPEGFNVEQVAQRVDEATHITAEAFLEAAVLTTIRPGIAPENLEDRDLATGPLEGFLYPDTYFVGEDETAATLVVRMVRRFEEVTAGFDWGRAPHDLSPYEVLILASLVEEEAKAEEERALIARVMINRIEEAMRLDIDATVQFLVKKYDGSALTQKDLEIDSPYNTRKFAGLPPGPISSPRGASITAVLDPADSDALFYVLTEDCVHHRFSRSYEEFLRAKARQPEEC